MRNTMMVALLAAVLAVPAAWAEEEMVTDSENTEYMTDQEAGTVDGDVIYEGEEIADDRYYEEPGTAAEDTMATTRREESEVSRGMLRDEVFGMKPQVGVISFDEPGTGDTASRGVVGILFDWNFASGSHFYVGPQFGGLFSHLGAPGSNFFGSDAPTGDRSGANIVTLPANFKVGYNFTDRFRIAAHGGANFVYRSIASSMNLGRDADNTLSDNWSVFPNLGGDVEFGLGRSVSLMLRPDWTFTPGDDFFTGTIALGIPLG
jgi:hypothetical protein